MAKHLNSSPLTQRFSRLSLAVAIGVLQSLVDATPAFIGNTYLRACHSVVHPPGLGQGALPYFTSTTLPKEARQELEWWVHYLGIRRGWEAFTSRSATLVPTWGDGSGTGTGGTIALPKSPMRMWQGQWSPQMTQFSSNTKELATLLLTLEQLTKKKL